MAGFLGLFKGDNLKSTLIAIAAILLAMGLFGSVAYAGYSWAKRGEAERMQEVREAMRAVFDKEKADLLAAYRRSDDIAKEVNELKLTITTKAGEQTAALTRLRNQFKEVYEVILPKEGVEQWEQSRELYNSAARRRSPQR